MQPYDERERLIESLAEHEETFSHSGEHTDSALQGFQADLEKLEEQLKQPPTADPFGDESACVRALEAVEAIGRDPSFTTRAQIAAEQKSPRTSAAQAPAADLGTLGQYRLLAKLGEGGMGAVYKALHIKLGKVVALKVLTADRLQDKHAVERFEREMLAVGNLHHVNIIAAHDAGEINGTHYLVMELVEGIDLGKLVKQRGRQPIGAACELIRQAALGLQHAHEHKLVHRDIKPSNLMLAFPQNRDEAPTVKVLDLGLALLEEAHLEALAELTTTGQVMGTPEYMAPEQGADTHSVDHRADIYSLGASLYKLLTGKAPFPYEQYRSPFKLMMAVATQEPPPISNLCPEITPEVAAVVQRMLRKDPQDRYGSARELAEALAPFSQPADLRTLVEFLTTAPAETLVNVNDPTFVGPSRTTNVHAEDKLTQAIATSPAASTVFTAEPLPGVVVPETVAPPLKMKSGWVTRVAMALLACVVFLFAANYRISVETPQGTLEILSDAPLRVTLKRDSKVLADGWSLNKGEGNTRLIQTGPVEIELPADVTGDFTITPNLVTLTKGGRETVRIERKKKPAIAAKAEPVTLDPVLPRDRAAAQWWMEAGGKGVVMDAVSGETTSLTAGGKLPDRPIIFRGAYSPPPGLKVADLQRLIGLDSLFALSLEGATIDDRAIDSVRQIPQLRQLSVVNTSISSSALSRLNHLPFLGEIQISLHQVNDNWQFLEGVRNLRTLILYEVAQAEPDLQGLGEFGQLREITLLYGKTPDASSVATLQRKNPRCRVIVTDSKNQPNLVGSDPVRAAVLQLASQGLQFTVKGPEGKSVSLSELDAKAPVTVYTMTIPPKTRLNAETIHLLGSVPAVWFYAAGLQHADEFVANLPADLAIGEIDFINSDLTDAGLRLLQRVSPITLLNLHGTKVTAEGITAFKKAMPACRILTDFGKFEPVYPTETVLTASSTTSPVVDRERVAAELWQKRGGHGYVRVKRTGEFRSLAPIHKLPDEPFEVVSAWEGAKEMTIADLEHFVNLTSLQDLTVAGESLDAKVIPCLKQMATVRTFWLERTRIPSSALGELRTLPFLRQLVISAKNLDDNWQFLEPLVNVRKLWIFHLQPSSADLQRLSKFTQLREIRFFDGGELDPAAVAELQRANPNCRVLSHAPHLKTYGIDPVRECVRQLVKQGVTFTAVPFDGVGALKPTIPEILDDPQPFIAEGAKFPVDFKPDRGALKPLSGIFFNYMELPGVHDIDAVIAALPDDLCLRWLQGSSSDLTDQGLMSIARWSQIEGLGVEKTRVTREGIKAFKQLVPTCRVTSDFGVSEAVLPIEKQTPETPQLDVVQQQRERAAAELWQRHGAHGFVKSKRSGDMIAFASDGTLPGEEFELIHAWGDPKEGFTNDELQHFVGLANLQTFGPKGDGLNADAIKYLKQMPWVEYFSLPATSIPTSALAELRDLPHLQNLFLSAKNLDDDWKFAAQLGGLRRLWIYDYQPTPQDLQRMAELTHLREIRFLSGTALDNAAVSEFQQRNPKCRLIVELPQRRTFGIDPVRLAVQEVVAAGISPNLIGFDGVETLKPTVKEILADPQPFNISALYVTADFKLAGGPLGYLNGIPFGWLGAQSLRNADAFAAALPDDLLVQRIDLLDSDLSDHGLKHLHRFTHLAAINVRNTKVTKEGVNAFHGAVPACEVISSWGTLKPVLNMK